MSIFHCQAKAISRAAGRSATAAAAYRAGERITDDRTGEIHDYRKKRGIVHRQIFIPKGCQSITRTALWNLSEAAENRKDAKVAREWEVVLPSELSAFERRDVARDFALAIVERYGVAVDMCIHAPGRKGDDRNHHAHFLTSTRVLTRNGFGGKTRVLDSPRTSGKEVAAVRELWERLCNMALARNGVRERVDRRTLKAQGIDRQPTRHLGPTASAMERRGVKSLRGDVHRRGRDTRLEKELAALRKIENGMEAARDRHALRKQQAVERAERLRQERLTRILDSTPERKTHNRGMSR